MNWLVFHIVSGQAFFTGIILVIIAVVVSESSRPIISRVAAVTFLIGIIAIAISSTAIPYWFYACAAVVTLAWIASRYKKSWRRWAPQATIAVWCLAAAMEIPYHITPSLDPAGDRTLTIIGDSVTAGIGGDETAETWPSLIAQQHQLQVQDISHVGETAVSALKRAKSQSLTGSLVVVEIGGNDILGSTTTTQFAEDLDALLNHLATPDRQVVMFELPLPPFYHEFGRIQRHAAAKHNVKLIPKRVLLAVIAGSDATLDTIHLSQSGHQFMADSVWRLAKRAFDAN